MSGMDDYLSANGLYAWKESEEERTEVYDSEKHRNVISVKRYLTPEELAEFAEIWEYAYECGQKDTEEDILRNLRGKS